MKNNKKRVFDISVILVIACILAVYSIVMIVPLVWGFITSLKSFMDFTTLENVIGLPSKEFSAEELRFANYATIWREFNFTQAVSYYKGDELISYTQTATFLGVLVNTVFYAVVGSVIQAFVPCLMGYLVVKYPSKAASFINAMMLFVMTLPILGSASTMIHLMRSLGLYDNFIGNWIQKFNFTGMYFFVFQAFFRSVSDSYAEAAEIDGASQLRVMFGIYIPLAWKMISTVVLILFVNCWNDYQTPLLYLPGKPTLAYAVYHITNRGGMGTASTPIKISASMMLALPILIIFIFLKDKIMGNISLGGEKE